MPGIYAALGILAALRQREQTGLGQLVDVGMFDVVASLVWDEPIELDDELGLGVRWGNSDPRGGPLNVYRTTDGWIALVVGSDTHWEHLCALMHRPDLAVYGATLADRTRHLGELDQVVAAWCAGQETGALAQALGEAGIPSSPVVDPIALRQDPHAGGPRHPDRPRPSGHTRPGQRLPRDLAPHPALRLQRRARPRRDPRGQHGPGAVRVSGPDRVRARRLAGPPGDLTFPQVCSVRYRSPVAEPTALSR